MYLKGFMATCRKKLFCFGYGYVSEQLSLALHENDQWTIAGTTRDPDKLEKLHDKGVEAYRYGPHKPLTDPGFALRDVTHILISIPPDDQGDPSFLMHADDILKIDTLQWFGYLSTTGVYGDKDGAWVDENSEISPTSKRGSRRVKAESQWLKLYQTKALPLHIFRLAGIYGPGRSALDSIRAGIARRIEKPGHAFNRIHVDDIVQTLMASMNNINPGQAYNLADDKPAASHEVISYACDLLDIEPPPLIPIQDADMAPIARSFYKDNKRISNHKIKHELGVDLRYPSYEEGLQACLASEQYGLSSLDDTLTEYG